ncbi:hypothetical protein [Bernardetia sp. MNP-M8]|uniref:hypothetical protein n=1 Tax=Bernardetia sp. MNP-M8 TaxID=3127470 RepID=UPI0030D48065
MNQTQPVINKPTPIGYEKMHRSLLNKLDDYNEGKEVGESINSNEQATLLFIYDTFVRLRKDKSPDTKIITWTNGKKYAVLVTNNQSIATQRGTKSEKTIRNHIKKLCKAGFMFKPKKEQDVYRKWFNFSIFLDIEHLKTYEGITIVEATTKIIPQAQKFHTLLKDIMSIEGVSQEHKELLKKFSFESYLHATNRLTIKCPKDAFEGIRNSPVCTIYNRLLSSYFGERVSVQHVF